MGVGVVGLAENKANSAQLELELGLSLAISEIIEISDLPKITWDVCDQIHIILNKIELLRNVLRSCFINLIVAFMLIPILDLVVRMIYTQPLKNDT